MNKILLILFLIFTSNANASIIVTPTSWSNGDTVTAAKLNSNQNAITTVVNGNLDNTNMATGYNLFQITATLPAPGNQGAVSFLTTNNTLNIDNGSAWQATVTPSGSLATGQIPYYNTGWKLLNPGSQYYSLVSNGTSSLPSFQQVDLTSGRGTTGTLAINQGGTGQTTANSALNSLFPSQTGNSGKFLTTDGFNSSWGTPANTSNYLFQYQGQVDQKGSGNGEFTGTTLVPNGITGNYRFLQWTDGSGNPGTVWTTKFIKTAGISTVTVHGRIWNRLAATSTRANLKVDVGGQNGNVNGTVSQITPEWVTFTINVSSLINGTAYDVTATLQATGVTLDAVYCSNIVAFGS